jgi:phosphonate transport system permease protein
MKPMEAAAHVNGASAISATNLRLGDFAKRYREQQRTKLMWTLLFGAIFLAAAIGSAIVGEIDLQRFARGLPKAWNYIHGTLPKLRWETLGADIANWYWGIFYWLRLLLETVVMSFVGTALGAIVGLALCFSASRNLSENRIVYFAARRLLEFFRTVPSLVFALIFVYAFGLGPFAGVLAIAFHTAGSLGKLFAEVNENVDPRPIEGVRAAGGTWAMIMRLAVVPQALPNYASYVLLRFEINVRSASVLGVVGAGGIGQDLYVAIRQFEYTDISAILLLMIGLVSIIDLGCETIRHRLIGQDMQKAS